MTFQNKAFTNQQRHLPTYFKDGIQNTEALITNKDKQNYLVVITNAKDKVYFIARTANIASYLRGVNEFLTGRRNYCFPVAVHTATTVLNHPHWGVEILSTKEYSSEKVVEHFEKHYPEWKQLGTGIASTRVASKHKRIVKITHTASGWHRYASVMEGRNPQVSLIVVQAVRGLIDQERALVQYREPQSALEKLYRSIWNEVDLKKDVFTVELFKDHNAMDPDQPINSVIRNLNKNGQEAWLSSFLKKAA